MNNKSVKIVEAFLRYAFLIFLIAAVILKRLWKNDFAEALSEIALVFGIALIVFKLLFWLFPKWFLNKPTLRQIEEKQFGDQ